MAKKASAKAPVASSSARQYFLTYLLPSGYTESELNNFKKEVAELVTKHKGTVDATNEWGKQKLAYKIKHSGKWHTEGVYVHLEISVDPKDINQLERDVYLNTHLMRHLLVIAEEEPTAVVPAPAVKEADEAV